MKIDQFNYTSLCSELAKMTEGLSGREIAKMGIAWQAAAYASKDGILTSKMVLDQCKESVRQHEQKVQWQSVQERVDSTHYYTSSKDSFFKPAALQTERFASS